MARSRSRRRTRRNPAGTLLVNPPRRGRKSHRRRSGRSMGLGSIFGRLLGRKRSNPKRRGSRRGKRNPLLFNPKRRRSRGKRVRVRGYLRRRNPLLSNPKRRRGHKRHRRNPLLSNPLRIRRSRKGHRRNPMTGVFGSVQRTAQKAVGWIPLVGGILSGAIGLVGGAIGGAIGVLPTAYAMPYVSKYIPDMLRPVGYTVAGTVLASLIRVVGPMLPVVGKYSSQIALVTAASGGAIDVYRWKHGQSQSLGDEDIDSLLSGADIGDDGAPLAATEYADASLADADYIGGDDLSGEEIAAAELGRRHYGRKFLKRQRGEDGGEGGSSGHAGKPGRRFGWLVYWVGFDNFQKIAALPESERKQAIAHMRHEAKLRARKLLSEGIRPDVQEAETAGLLVA